MKTPPAPDPRVFQARAFPATDFATVLGALGTASAANKTTNTLTITRQSAAPFCRIPAAPVLAQPLMKLVQTHDVMSRALLSDCDLAPAVIFGHNGL